VVVAALLALTMASCNSKGHRTDAGSSSSHVTTTSTTSAAGAGGGAANTGTTAAAGTKPTVSRVTTPAGAAPTGPNQLAMPKPGDYTFHDVVTRDGKDTVGDVKYALTTHGNTVRTQQKDAKGSAASAYFEEDHRPDGLFVTRSVLSTGSCEWSPPSPSLPQVVIDGGKASAHSTCSLRVNGKSFTFDLSIDLAFKAARECVIQGINSRCVDVTRHRVLKSGDAVETVDAMDTFALNLGLRVDVSETVSTQDRSSSEQHTHRATLTDLPA
jgi:hypothetical protein